MTINGITFKRTSLKSRQMVKKLKVRKADRRRRRRKRRRRRMIFS